MTYDPLACLRTPSEAAQADLSTMRAALAGLAAVIWAVEEERNGAETQVEKRRCQARIDNAYKVANVLQSCIKKEG